MIACGHALKQPTRGTLGEVYKKICYCCPEGYDKQCGAGNLIKKKVKR
ncbi:hypothetical protein SCFA_3570002 [anaerobic digester metagenome]|uniref:Uncharacterized protein n=1 Tax=anaerobic digester metagenome TaxID=1263854 RepID=A0A485M6E2_9ZZZZ